MCIKNLKNAETRRPISNVVRWCFALLLVLCVVGGAMAANDTFTMYTDEDMANAQATWDSSGVGVLVALIVLVSSYAPYIVLVLLGLLAIVAKMSKSSETHNSALQAMFSSPAWLFFCYCSQALQQDRTPLFLIRWT